MCGLVSTPKIQAIWVLTSKFHLLYIYKVLLNKLFWSLLMENFQAVNKSFSTPTKLQCRLKWLHLTNAFHIENIVKTNGTIFIQIFHFDVGNHNVRLGSAYKFWVLLISLYEIVKGDTRNDGETTCYKMRVRSAICAESVEGKPVLSLGAILLSAILRYGAICIS